MLSRLPNAMHVPADAVHPVIGFVGAAISAATIRLAQVLPNEVQGWFEGGAYIGLVCFLIYAVTTMWRRLKEKDKESAELQKEIRDDWKKQNEKLIKVLNRLDPDT